MTPAGEQLAAVRLRCAQLVERLDITHPFDVDDLRRRLERDRGKSIRVYDLPPGGREAGACGLLLPAREPITCSSHPQPVTSTAPRSSPTS